MDESRPELKQLVDQFDKAEALAAADLVGKERLGELSFEKNVGDAKRLLDLIQGMRELPLDELPTQRRGSFLREVQAALVVVEQMKNFSPTNQNPEVRSRIITGLAERWEHLFSEAAPVAAFFRSRPLQLSALETKRAEALAAIEAAQQKTNDLIREREREADEILSSMRRAAADVGVSAHAKHFAEQAQEHRKAARSWLMATILIAVIAIVVAASSFYHYFTAAKDVSPAQGVQIMAAKLVLFSIFYFTLIWSARNYRAQRHNYVVAKHRQNALSTFQTFVEGTSDEATRNAVLLRATEAIFSPSLSGYIPGEPEPQGNTQILEILRGGPSS